MIENKLKFKRNTKIYEVKITLSDKPHFKVIIHICYIQIKLCNVIGDLDLIHYAAYTIAFRIRDKKKYRDCQVRSFFLMHNST